MLAPLVGMEQLLNRRIFGSGGHAIRGKLMHYAFRDMFGKVKSCRWTDGEFEAMVVGGRATFLFDDHGAFIKDDHRFPNRRQLQEGATLRDEARASCRTSRCAVTHATSPRFRPC